MNAHDKNVAIAEVNVVSFLVQHNLPLATLDHLGPLFKYIFPNRKIASSFACGRAMTSAILNETLDYHAKNIFQKTANPIHLH